MSGLKTPRKVISLRALESANIEDLNLRRAARALSEVGETQLRVQDAWSWLVEHRAAVWCDGVLRPTVAGMILFGRRPHLFLPGMRIEASIRGEVQTWTGTLKQLCDRLMATPAVLWEREPELARQLVLNSLLHRSWSEPAASRPIRLTLEEGRLEMRTPGRLPKRWQLGTSTPTYPKLHELARYSELIRGVGEGLGMLSRSLKALGARPFSLLEDADDVVLLAEWNVRPSRAAPSGHPTSGGATPIAREPVLTEAPRSSTPNSFPAQPRSLPMVEPVVVPGVPSSNGPFRAAPPPQVAADRAVPPPQSVVDRSSFQEEQPPATTYIGSSLPITPADKSISFPRGNLPWAQGLSRDAQARLIDGSAPSDLTGASVAVTGHAPRASFSTAPIEVVAKPVSSGSEESLELLELDDDLEIRVETLPIPSSPRPVVMPPAQKLETRLPREETGGAWVPSRSAQPVPGYRSAPASALTSRPSSASLTRAVSAPSQRAVHAPSRPAAGPQPRKNDKDSSGGYLSLEERQRLLLEQLRRGRQSRSELMESLGWKRGTTRNVIESLIRSERIRPMEASTRSPQQVYELA